MALFRPGLLCPICKLPIERGQPKVGFPAFMTNGKDPLRLFNDAVVHTACWEVHPLKPQVLRRLAQKEEFRKRAHVCESCGEVIDDLAEMYTPGHLTDDESHPAFEFNYV